MRTRITTARSAAAALAALTLLGGCAGPADLARPQPSGVASPSPAAASPTDLPRPASPAAPTPVPTAPPTAEPTAPSSLATAAPDWLGTRVLPRDDRGFGVVEDTPPELVDRRIVTTDLLPPPPDDAFHATVAPVPDDVLARSTWDPACPVTRDELRYVTVAFWGFDGRTHTGELLVHRDAADAITRVFADLHAARFPIEEMRITRPDELDAPPTGDGNDTGSFVCRPSRGQTRWSQHAYGLAVDVNPFQNPYVKGDVVLPELASAYTDRADERPGMVRDHGPVTDAFDAIGWGWGGRWSSLTDWMHFSADGT